ncbi:L-rhamnose mutarotase [Fulvivirga sp. M361]|uniref:L-rhamnose mutarotase n=1 Tax=Fulvivirga sp. M361 TaxID=2594266 RepID=UPI0011799674|nr:L-rhamnose mutarotase [Fulvivirga sp. M361]TRX57630.1 L-rhamnose mutarotase [Fulvivirga sp. M361]
MKRYCLACDLKDRKDLIEQYKSYHAKGQAWTEITESIKKTGILDMEIYLTGNRLFMVMEVEDWFDFQRKAEYDAQDSKVQEWEKLMGQFQQPLPWAGEGEKWILTDRIYKLEE